jgi:hypothetical protein
MIGLRFGLFHVFEEFVDKPVDGLDIGELGPGDFQVQLAHRTGNDFDDIEAVGAVVLHRFGDIDVFLFDIIDVFHDIGLNDIDDFTSHFRTVH